MKKILCFLVCISLAGIAQPPTYSATVNNPPAGYYFISAYKSTSLSYPMILDGSGQVVYYKKITGSNSLDFRLHPTGHMSYFSSFGVKYMVMDSTFNFVDTITAVGCFTDGHELQILPNGNYLLLGYENITQDLSAYNYFNNNGTPGSTSATVKCNIIQELDPNENLLFDWHHKNYFPFDEIDTFFVNGPNFVDWSHSNALESDLDGNILMSSRHFSEISKIDRNTGNVIWHFGGNYNQFTFLTDTVPFYGQHDIRRLPNGHITLYDNGYHNADTRHAARALEYELDEINMTAKLVWSYEYDSLMISNSQGSVQVLPNKNALINYGTVNKDSVCFSMVDSLGAELYKIKFTNGSFSYRAHYYSTLPWQIKRPTISCFDSLGVYYLKIDSAYSSYLWNSGDTTSSITITNTGTYYVFVPYGPGGYVSSYALDITDLNGQCAGITSIAGTDRELGYRLFPNPALNQVTIFCPELTKSTMPVLSDVYGNRIELSGVMCPDGNSYTFDISQLDAGVYFLNVKCETFKFIKGKD